MASKSIKLDKNDELLMAFEAEGGAVQRSYTGVGKVPRTKVEPMPNPLQGIDSWTILRELFSRHAINVQVAGFWCLLFGIILFRTGLF